MFLLKPVSAVPGETSVIASIEADCPVVNDNSALELNVPTFEIQLVSYIQPRTIDVKISNVIEFGELVLNVPVNNKITNYEVFNDLHTNANFREGI